MKKEPTNQKNQQEEDKGKPEKEISKLVQENKEFAKKLNNFYGNDYSCRNNYIKLYSKIANNKDYWSEFTFNPEKRIVSLVEFALRKKRFNKDYLNNVFISHITKLLGYCHTNSMERIYLAESKLIVGKRDITEHIFLPEHLLENKLGRHEISTNNLDTNLNILSLDMINLP